MKMLDKQALLEGLKEWIRTSVYGFISFLLTEGVLQAVIVGIFGDRLPPATVLIITGGLTAALRGLDKILHEKGVEQPLDLQGMDALIT